MKQLLSSSSQLSLSSDNNVSDDESNGINSLSVINRDEEFELDTSGEAEAQSIVCNATVMEGCIAAIAEPLRQCHTSESPPETCADIGGLLPPMKSIGENVRY